MCGARKLGRSSTPDVSTQRCVLVVKSCASLVITFQLQIGMSEYLGFRCYRTCAGGSGNHRLRGRRPVLIQVEPSGDF